MKTGGIGASLSAVIHESLFNELDHEVRRGQQAPGEGCVWGGSGGPCLWLSWWSGSGMCRPGDWATREGLVRSRASRTARWHHDSIAARARRVQTHVAQAAGQTLRGAVGGPLQAAQRCLTLLVPRCSLGPRAHLACAPPPPQVLRLSSQDVPTSYAYELEAATIVQPEKVVQAVHKVCGARGLVSA